MAQEWMVEAADDGTEWKIRQRRKKAKHRKGDFFASMRIPDSFQGCMIDKEDAEKMHARICELLPAGDERDMIIAMILGRGDGLEDEWSGY